MDEVKPKSNKVKREVKNAVALYLQRRNYGTIQTFITPKKRLLTQTLVENCVERPNSILYRCDPMIINHNFTKFLQWLREQIKFKNRCHDIEAIVAPLFCHLHLEILKYENNDVAASFFKSHFASMKERNCEGVIRDLIFTDGSKDISKLRDTFRKSRIVIELQADSLENFKTFILQNCHIIFLQILKTYFDFQVIDSVEKKQKKMISNVEHKQENIHEFINCINELKKELTPIFNTHLNNSKHPISCGLLKRESGLVIFVQLNILYITPIHPFNSIFDLKRKSQIKLVTHHSGQIYSIDLSANNQILATGSGDGTLCIYDLESMCLVKKCAGHLGPIYSVKISSNNSYIATGSVDGTARLWDVNDGKVIRIFCGHTQAVTCVEFHPNCLYLATGSADRNIRLWCVNKASSLRLLHTSKGGLLYNLAISPCGKLLASSSDDKSIRIWDILASKVIYELKCKDSLILKIVWKSDGSEVCAGTIDGIIRVWNINKNQENGESNKYIEPYITQPLNCKLINLDFAFNTYGALTV